MTTTNTPRVRVLRGVEPQPAELSAVRARAARHLVVDPDLVRAATDDGYRAGYQAGFTAGLEDAAAAIDARERSRGEQLACVLEGLAAAADAIGREHAAVIADVEARIAELAVDIAGELVGRELAAAGTRGRDALARALRLAPDTAPVTARLHPDDVATAGAHLDDLASGRSLTVVADPSLEPGDCVVDVGATRIDARVAPALERVRAVLDGAAP